jgi:predicted nucleic acid-binding Zn ribbon protein
MEHNPNDPMCKCEKCMMTKDADIQAPTNTCTADSPDCGDAMCEKCMNKSIDIWDGTGFGKRNFTAAQRKKDAKTGVAMPDGSFPIASAKDLANAIRLYGHAANPDAAKAHIKARAAALGLSGSLPDAWKK